MKVSISWLKELVNLNISVDELLNLLPLRTVSIKEVSDDFIELDMKGYNRADLLSMRGVAREVAAITNSKLNFNPAGPQPTTYGVLPKIDAEVKDEKLCLVYCLAKIENLKVEHSYDTWVKKLSDCGIRAINNVADITNLVMLEYGQPMHAFDARGVKDESIIVRTAKEGERITTLDGKTRDLATSDLMIADPLNVLGIAGVMGGKDSEISPSTTTILLEAAIFDPVSIRRTSQKHGLPSEASKRFQHGLTKTNLLQALFSAIKMYEQMGGKLTAMTLVGDTKDEVKKVKLTQQKVNSLIGLGLDISPEQVETSLEKLGFRVEPLRSIPKGGTLQEWAVEIPYWRLDIEIEEDLIEEVARMYGYENIPAKELAGAVPAKIDQSLPHFIYDLKKSLVNLGLTEVQTYSFYSSSVLNNLDWNKENLVKIANPISSETEYLRDNLWPNLLEVVAKNIKNGFKDVAIFEVGKVYVLPKAKGKTSTMSSVESVLQASSTINHTASEAGPYSPQTGDLPKETYRVSMALSDSSNNPVPELYQAFQKALKHLRGEKMRLHLGGGNRGDYENKYFHPTRFSYLANNSKNIGGIAEVHPRFVDRFGVQQRVAVLEIELELLI